MVTGSPHAIERCRSPSPAPVGPATKKIITFAATALAALTATAAAPSPTEGAHIWLTVTRTTIDGISYTGNLWLDCPGIEGAGRPYRESACTDLDAADGDLDALPGQDTAVCSNDVVRVVTTVDGTYEGRSVRWERTYESECDLILATGRIFDF